MVVQFSILYCLLSMPTTHSAMQRPTNYKANDDDHMHSSLWTHNTQSSAYTLPSCDDNIFNSHISPTDSKYSITYFLTYNQLA